IRCFVSCILPCGALDVVRIVHVNGRVQELAGDAVTAAEIMKINPKHVLKKRSSPSPDDGAGPRSAVVPPEAILRRGKIYFLIPLPPEQAKSRRKSRKGDRRKVAGESEGNLVIPDRYLSDILSEKVPPSRNRRRGRVGVWRPNLEIIHEAAA
ncbi:hypothetical protein M569_14887, partial [Genlisea aurea]